MSGKGGDVSPVRVSRLKKRRRPKECALQNLPSSSKQSRHAGVSVHGVDGNCKENILNGRPPMYGREYIRRDGSSECAVVGKNHGLEKIALQWADSSLQSAVGGMKGEQSLKEHSEPCHDLKSDESTLEFMDNLEQSALLSSIPSMLGIDMTRYQSCADFKQELEQAFECKANHSEKGQTKKYHEFSAQNEIYHSLVGRIDPSGTFGCEEHSIAFPQFKSLNLEATPKDYSNRMMLQHLNLNRKTGHGMCIPLFWYQFPIPQIQRSSSPDMVLLSCDEQPAKINVGERAAKRHLSLETMSDNQDDDRQYSKKNETKQPSKDPLLPGILSVHCDDERQSSEKNEKEEPSLTSKFPPSSMKCRGKIQIISDKGATIREVCDIDKSNHVIGKLYEGDERYFIEAKILSPPPISIDDSDDESDEECVSVLRYKIVLKLADCSASVQFAEKVSGHLVGWISDRGRLADDSYLIVRKV